MYQSIIFSTDGAIATIKLNRPDKLNAFGGPMREEILDALGLVAADDTIRVLVVTGEGRGFSAGGDIDYLKTVREKKDEQAFRDVLSAGQKITRMFRSMCEAGHCGDQRSVRRRRFQFCTGLRYPYRFRKSHFRREFCADWFTSGLGWKLVSSPVGRQRTRM